jgi:hypothetical protein
VIHRTAQRIKFKLRQIAISMGIDFYMGTEDRRLLEKIILPQFSGRPDVKKVLFIGCDWYTRGYRRFFAQQELWTLDIDPAQGKYGSKRHITDSVVNVERHFRKGELDLIVCNGVFGWGLNTMADVDKTFAAFNALLRPEGVFILGWNDIPESTPISLDDSDSLRLFTRYDFPPLGSWRFRTPTEYRHTYDFYVK